MSAVATVYTQHFCAKCGSDQIRRNGTSEGHAPYQCKACRQEAQFVPAAVAKAVQYAKMDRSPVERNSQRSIVWATGVACMTVVKRLTKSERGQPPAAASAPKKGAENALGSPGDGRNTDFRGPKKRKTWLWQAVERAS